MFLNLPNQLNKLHKRYTIKYLINNIIGVQSQKIILKEL